MRKLSVFNFISLDGYYKGPNEDISWHKHGGEKSEESNYSAKSLQAGNTLLFGRVTYEMMASFWPTAMAMESDSRTAKGMNDAEKIVFSKTLKQSDPVVRGWANTTVINGDIIAAAKKLKESRGQDLTILGSGSIISQFADAGLIDAYQIMVDPVAIGDGTSIFHGIKQKLELKLTGTRTFKSGAVMLTYEV